MSPRRTHRPRFHPSASVCSGLGRPLQGRIHSSPVLYPRLDWVAVFAVMLRPMELRSLLGAQAAGVSVHELVLSQVLAREKASH